MNSHCVRNKHCIEFKNKWRIQSLWSKQCHIQLIHFFYSKSVSYTHWTISSILEYHLLLSWPIPFYNNSSVQFIYHQSKYSLQWPFIALPSVHIVFPVQIVQPSVSHRCFRNSYWTHCTHWFRFSASVPSLYWSKRQTMRKTVDRRVRISIQQQSSSKWPRNRCTECMWNRWVWISVRMAYQQRRSATNRQMMAHRLRAMYLLRHLRHLMTPFKQDKKKMKSNRIVDWQIAENLHPALWYVHLFCCCP